MIAIIADGPHRGEVHKYNGYKPYIRLPLRNLSSTFIDFNRPFEEIANIKDYYADYTATLSSIRRFADKEEVIIFTMSGDPMDLVNKLERAERERR